MTGFVLARALHVRVFSTDANANLGLAAQRRAGRSAGQGPIGAAPTMTVSSRKGDSWPGAGRMARIGAGPMGAGVTTLTFACHSHVSRRKRHAERSPTLTGQIVDPAAEPEHDLAADGKAKSGATGFAVIRQAHELFKDHLLMLWSDPGSVINEINDIR